jgi:tetratricopeptide (TPR) repeat protein
MKGRMLFWPLVVLLAVLLVVQSGRWRNRLLASQLVRQVQLMTASVASSNPGALVKLLPYDLGALRQAADADPSAVEVPLARGSVYLLLKRPQEAADNYRRAIDLEPHPEIYLHLSEALLAAGEVDEARRNYGITVKLDPWLRGSVPSGLL